MTKPPLHRRGTYAVIDGVIYEASYPLGRRTVYLNYWGAENPNPALYQWDEEARHWVGEVPVNRCTAVFEVNPTAKYRGHRVYVETFSDSGLARAKYGDRNGAWATANGFIEENKYEFFKNIPVGELQDYAEDRRDLLFPAWRTANFAEPAGGAQ
ncbi:hypothetical protein SAMN05421504_11562 [Amycolatopsis xylanica]|uniref:Uncharacterized protein n=1 Tax=Amycolatopsis xylanica TaxID=589385 RepID=A0A1H3SSK4_9PSEU|nr:hypothetical protein [Amycolatopsis xylanica]SDZ40658.1 hypothetical protein SAMN05421504_11562 [Amycolatopsis xylanica]